MKVRVRSSFGSLLKIAQTNKGKHWIQWAHTKTQRISLTVALIVTEYVKITEKIVGVREWKEECYLQESTQQDNF